MSLKSFVQSHGFGLVMRFYATSEDPDKVTREVKALLEAIKAALRVEVVGVRLFDEVCVSIFADPRYPHKRDSGLAFEILLDLLHQEELDDDAVSVDRFAAGDIYCALLNDAARGFVGEGFDYFTSFSYQARSCMNSETMTAVVQALAAGALVVPVAYDQGTDLIMRGCGSNAFCTYDLPSLMSVGGFDFIAREPINQREALCVRVEPPVWTRKEGELEFNEDWPQTCAGVEEVVPIARMYLDNIDADGNAEPCVAPILARGSGVKRYEIPDPEEDPQGWAHHYKKFKSKRQRQAWMLAMRGYSHELIESAVMPAYRNEEFFTP